MGKVDELDNLLTRKEFEDACGDIKRSTLRYYENKGLLKPVKTDKNGYKYYTVSQLYTFFHISMLRKINCSVSEISEIMLKPDSLYENIFDKKQESLDEMIKSLNQIKKTLEIMRYFVKHFPDKMLCMPVLKIGNNPFYYRLIPTDGNGEHSIKQFLERRKIDRNIISKDNRYLFYPMGVWIDKDKFLSGSNRFDSYILAVTDKDCFDDCMCTGIGAVATYSYTTGSPLTQIKHLNNFRKYILDNGFTILSGIYETIVPIRVDSDTEAEYLNIISVSIADNDVFRVKYDKQNERISINNEYV